MKSFTADKKIFGAPIVALNIFNPMKPRKLPYKKFLESFRYAPRPAVNLLVVREDDAILLTKRKKPPFAGYWHLPGSFILKGESLMDCVNRVAKEELGVKVENITLAGAFDDLAGDPRGHAVDLVYRCHIKIEQNLQKRPGLLEKGRAFPKPIGDSAEIRFFQKLPTKIGFNHRDTLVKLRCK